MTVETMRDVPAKNASNVGDTLGEVKRYDFASGKQLTKDQRVGLNAINETFAKLMTAYFTTLFRILVDIRFVSIEEVLFGNFMTSRPDPDSIWTFQMGGEQNVTGLIEFEPSFTFSIIDKLFGGSGHGGDVMRSITYIEQNLMRRVINRTLKMWDQSWQNLIDHPSQMMTFESKPFMVQIAAKNELIIQIRFEAQIRKENYNINICLPFKMIEPYLQKMKEQAWSLLLPQKIDEKERKKIQSALLGVKIPFVVTLGQSKLKLGEFFELEEGDVIMLDTRLSDPLSALIGKKFRYFVTPGVSNGQKAVKVVDIHIDEE